MGSTKTYTDAAGRSQEGLELGEYLKRKLALEGLSIAELAEKISVHPQTIYNVTAGKRSISSNLALKLSQQFIEKAEFWLRDYVPVEDLERAGMRPSGDADILRARAEEASARRSMGGAVSGILVDRDIRAAVESAAELAVKPYDASKVQGASMDLSIGLVITKGFDRLSRSEWMSVLALKYDPGALDKPERARITAKLKQLESDVVFERSLELGPGQSCVIMSREHVTFGGRFLADVGPTAENSLGGLVMGYGRQVDPGYSGHLFSRAVNLSDDPFELIAQDSFLTLVIHRLAAAPERLYQQSFEARTEAFQKRLYTAIEALFTFSDRTEEGGEGDEAWKISWIDSSNDFTFFSKTKPEAFSAGLEWLSRQLRQMIEGGSHNPEIKRAVETILDSIVLSSGELAAVGGLLGLDDEALDAARKVYTETGSKQTLFDNLRRLGRNLLADTLRLIESIH
tara:strand:- start:2058 stop:3428 length:1371 start_codon:yes stop_codon:yes gene_type:complete